MEGAAGFSSGRLAGMQAGGLEPLLLLMASRNGNLQHNAAFALYGLADSDDNVAAIVRHGGVQALKNCDVLVQASAPGCQTPALSWAPCPGTLQLMMMHRMVPLTLSPTGRGRATSPMAFHVICVKRVYQIKILM